MAEIKYTPLDKTILAALVGVDRFTAHQEVVEAARKSGEALVALIRKNPLFAHYLASIGGGCRITVEAGNDGEISLIWDGSKKAKKASPPPIPGGTLSNSKGPTMKALRARAELLGVDITDLGRKRSAIAERLAEHESWNRAGVEAAVVATSTPLPKSLAEPDPIVPPVKVPAPPEKKEVANPVVVQKQATPTPPKPLSLEDALGDIFNDASETLSAATKEEGDDSDVVIVESYVPIRRTPRVRIGSPVSVTVVDLEAKIKEAAELDLAAALSEEVDEEMPE